MLREVPLQVQQGVLSLLNISVADLLDFSFAGGGCINHGGKLVTTQGIFFLKWNDALKLPNMFEAEAKGLNLLRNTNTINIPKVIGYGQRDDFQFLLLEFVDQGKRSGNFWIVLADKLAALHRISSEQCGLDHDNYIGSLRQFNSQSLSYVDFFIEQRLKIQLALARDNGLIDSSGVKKFEQLFTRLPALLPIETICLLHGDLWSGNVIVDENGDPTLIDPAVYFGHREADLAMTRLFGGFDQYFYKAYEEAFPLQPGYDHRVDIYNLYPLLVHLNLFGLSYRTKIFAIVDRFI